MPETLLPSKLLTASPLARRSFLRYTGASVALGSLWLAGCEKKEQPNPTPPATAPTISGFSPTSGPVGTSITLTGTNFTGATTVSLGGVAASFTIISANGLTLTVPAGAATGAIAVTTPAGTATSNTTFIVAAAAPSITGFSPANGVAGATIVLTGTNLAGATAVTVGGVAATFTAVTATGLTFIIPAGATSGPVVVTTPAGTAVSATSFTVQPSLVNVGTGDWGVLNYIYALEQLEAAFFTQVRLGAYFAGLGVLSAERAMLDDVCYHEVIHRDWLRAALGSAGVTPIRDLDVDFAAVNFNDRNSVLTTARSLEDLMVAAYSGVVPTMTSPGYLQMLLKISSVEARHAALVRDVITEGTFVGTDVVDNLSLARPQGPVAVATAVNNFLRDGSKLDVSGIA